MPRVTSLQMRYTSSPPPDHQAFVAAWLVSDGGDGDHNGVGSCPVAIAAVDQYSALYALPIHIPVSIPFRPLPLPCPAIYVHGVTLLYAL